MYHKYELQRGSEHAQESSLGGGVRRCRATLDEANRDEMTAMPAQERAQVAMIYGSMLHAKRLWYGGPRRVVRDSLELCTAAECVRSPVAPLGTKSAGLVFYLGA